MDAVYVEVIIREKINVEATFHIVVRQIMATTPHALLPQYLPSSSRPPSSSLTSSLPPLSPFPPSLLLPSPIIREAINVEATFAVRQIVATTPPALLLLYLLLLSPSLPLPFPPPFHPPSFSPQLLTHLQPKSKKAKWS